MDRSRSFLYSFAIAALAAAATANAQVVVVTPSNPFGWATATYGSPGAIGAITSDYPQSGNGSGLIRLVDGDNQEADIYNDFSIDRALSNLTALSFDWYRASGDAFPNFIAPAFALHMSDDSYLVWERAYNVAGAAPLDTWTTENLLNGTFWRGAGSAGPTSGVCSTYGEFVTLGQFDTDCYGNAGMVRGIDMFMGYAYPGTFEGAVDNATIGFGTAAPTTYNFEVDRQTATPEPASLALLATGFVGLGLVARRRKSGR